MYRTSLLPNLSTYHTGKFVALQHLGTNLEMRSNDASFVFLHTVQPFFLKTLYGDEFAVKVTLENISLTYLWLDHGLLDLKSALYLRSTTYLRFT